MSFIIGPMPAFSFGLLAGILFGASMAGLTAWLSKSKRGQLQVSIEMKENEQIVFSGPSNHKLGMEYRGGRLYLTNDRLAFRAHAFNIQRRQVDLPLKEVKRVSPSRTFGIVPNGLLVETTNKQMHRFVVGNREQWLDYLNFKKA